MKDKMRKNSVFPVAALCGLMTLSGCAKDVLDVYEQEEAEPSSVLHVFTRSGEASVIAADVPDPVSLYLFDNTGKCVRMISDLAEESAIRIPGGTYDVCAVAGAESSRYVMPELATAVKTSELPLQTGQSYGDLMLAKAHFTVADAAEHNLSLSMKRAVMNIRRITIKKVPAGITDVRVTLSPLCEKLLLDGTYSGNLGSYQTGLTKDADGTTWYLGTAETDADVYLLPSADNATITVDFVSSTGTKSYSYSSDQELPANHKVVIDGTYTEQATLQLTGVVSTSDWEEDKSISFEFDETKATASESGSGSSGSGGGSESGSESGSGDSGSGDSGSGDSGSGGGSSEPVALPTVGSLYLNKYYVLSVDEATHSFVVLSPTRKAMNINSTVSETDAIQTLETALSSWEESPVGVWRIPEVSETALMADQKLQIKSYYEEFSVGNIKIYCIGNGGELKWIIESSSTASPQAYNSNSSGSCLRPVATITLSN